MLLGVCVVSLPDKHFIFLLLSTDHTCKNFYWFGIPRRVALNVGQVDHRQMLFTKLTTGQSKTQSYPFWHLASAQRPSRACR